MSEEERESFQLVDAAADLFGGLAGVTIALAHQGITGLYEAAVVAPGVTHSFKYAARLFLSRVMAKREQQRVGFVYGLTAVAIQRRLNDGEHIRTDDFFDPDITDRSKADEIAEAVLISAQREHEEKKLPYLANLLAFVVFDRQFDAATANYMVKIASSLTYRQYCILALALNPSGAGLHPAPFNQRQTEDPFQVLMALTECFELYRQDLITFRRGEPIQSVEDMPLDSISVHDSGARLCLAMKLDTIPNKDVNGVSKLFAS